MKKISKIVLSFILGILVALTINVAAETLIGSEGVSYSNNKTAETTVSGALDELFSAIDISRQIGSTDISTIGDGTISGAISELNSNLESVGSKVDSLGSEYGGFNYVLNSNGGGFTYYKKFGNLVIGCINAEHLLYNWNPGAYITNNPLPKPATKISISIQQYSDGSLIPCYINTDGYIINGAETIGLTGLPLSSFFMYYTAE